MANVSPISRCTQKAPLEFAWAGIGQPTAVDAVEAAVLTFEQLIDNVPGLFWDPRHRAITIAEYRGRLKRGMAGRLEPVTHVKEMDRAREEHVFELIYDFNVIELDANGVRKSRKMKTRTYFSEPPEHPKHFVGLHMHEKILVPHDHGAENDLQNVEVDVAVRYYDLGRATKWGI